MSAIDTGIILSLCRPPSSH